MPRGHATRPIEWGLFQDKKEKIKAIPKHWGGARRGAGRKRVEIPLDVLQAVAENHSTIEEIAAYFGVTPDTIYKRKATDPRFAQVLERGRQLAKFNLRRNQNRMAQHDARMAVWLGKQYLDQKDHIEQSGKFDSALNAEVAETLGKAFSEYLNEVRALRRGDFRSGPVVEVKAENA